MKKRLSFAPLALLVLSIAPQSLAQQPQATPRRGDQQGTSGATVAPGVRTRRTATPTRTDAPAPGAVSLEGIEGDVSEALGVI